MHTNEGHHLVFDPNSASRLWDPFDSAYVEPRASGREAWGTLQHERVCRLMSSLGFLWRLTGDRRYADWVSAGLTQIRDRYDAQIARGEQERGKFGGLYHTGLYEAQSISFEHDLQAPVPWARGPDFGFSILYRGPPSHGVREPKFVKFFLVVVPR